MNFFITLIASGTFSKYFKKSFIIIVNNAARDRASSECGYLSLEPVKLARNSQIFSNIFIVKKRLIHIETLEVITQIYFGFLICWVFSAENFIYSERYLIFLC